MRSLRASRVRCYRNSEWCAGAGAYTFWKHVLTCTFFGAFTMHGMYMQIVVVDIYFRIFNYFQEVISRGIAVTS